MKKYKFLALLLAAVLLGSVIPGGWAAGAADPQTAIPPLLTQEHFAFMNGTGTGTFEPTRPLTRSEAAATFARKTMEVEDEGASARPEPGMTDMREDVG